MFYRDSNVGSAGASRPELLTEDIRSEHKVAGLSMEVASLSRRFSRR
jgi:hypothetical protein